LGAPPAGTAGAVIEINTAVGYERERGIMPMRKAVAGLLLLFTLSALASVSHADRILKFTWHDFKNHRIEIQKFLLVTLNDDGTRILGMDKEEIPQNIRKGFATRLHIFHLKNGALETVRTILLPFPDIPQMAETPDFKTSLLIGKGGTQILLLDLETGKSQWVFKHKAGAPGFKCKSVVKHFEDGFYAYGYTYDKNQKKIFDGLVKIDLAKANTPGMFIPVLDYSKAKTLMKLPRRGMNFGGPDLLYLVSIGISSKQVMTDAYILYAYDGKGLKHLDSGYGFAMIASSGPRFVYGTRRKAGTYEVIVKDVKLNKTWTAYQGPRPLNYYYISRGDAGKTILACDDDMKSGKSTVYYGHEKDGYALKSIPELRNVPFGGIRMSNNGKYYLFMSKEGLFMGTVPE
jgi:hypothetical protein